MSRLFVKKSAFRSCLFNYILFRRITVTVLLVDLGAVSRFQVRAAEPLGTLSYKTSSKRSQLFWHLIGVRKSLCFSAQSE